jgi:hypothetical protein
MSDRNDPLSDCTVVLLLLADVLTLIATRASIAASWCYGKATRKTEHG